ncbi:MAG: permease [Actinomycetota bacterium]|nr:permease [Actinomycetota bacterium]
MEWLVNDIFGLKAKAAEIASFFLYDSIKILFLLFVLISIIGFVRTYLPQDKLKSWMNRRGLAGNFFASLFGAITPFCSCSSIPIFLGFLEAGVPLGVTFSFLITSPIINEYLVILMLGFFDFKITVAYVVSGLLIGTVAGSALGRMNLEEELVSDFAAKRSDESCFRAEEYPNFASRAKFGLSEAKDITAKVWLWVLFGVGIGALIHNFVPDEAIQLLISRTGIFSVPIAVLIGVPMYGSCAAIVPIAVVLFQKGIPLGTALSFMMAVSALSLPQAVVLRRAMKLKMISIFFAITTVAMIFTGYMFNFLQRALV